MITNFAQLKRAYADKKPFEIIKHFIKPEYTGQRRVPQIVQTNAMYSAIYGDPSAYISRQNGGRGSFIGYGKASDYVFAPDGTITQSVRGTPIWTIRFLEN